MSHLNEKKQPPPALGRIAIIAVHGVGDPGMGSTAQSIATLLARLEQKNGHSVYAPFSQTGVTLSNREVNAGVPEGTVLASHQELVTQSQGPVSTLLRSTPRVSVSSDPISFIRSQLEGFKPTGDDRTYETVRHNGQRLLPGSAARPVDVYEVYWADLMRIGTGIVTFFTELYQLMFHLSHLASKTVSAARSMPPQKPADLTPHPRLWKAFDIAVTVASQYLAGVVFLLNVWLVPVVLLASLMIGGKSIWICAMSGLFLVVLGALSWRGFYRARAPWLFQIMLILLVLADVGILIIHGTSGFGNFFSAPHFHGFAVRFNIVVFLAFASALVAGLVIKYDEANPNSRTPALLLGALVWGVMLVYLCDSSLNHPVPVIAGLTLDSATWAVLQATVWLALFADINYAMLLFLELVAIVLGCLLLLKTSRTTQGPLWNRIYRILGTVVFGLGLPTVMFSMVTMTAWAAYTKLALPHFTHHWFVQNLSEKLLAIDSPGFVRTICGAGIAVLLGIAVLTPSVLAEFTLFNLLDRKSAQRLGGWLTGGGITLVVAMFLLFLSGIVPFLSVFSWVDVANAPNQFSAPLLFSFLAGTGLTVLVLKDHLGEWTLAIGPILNKILDVDSYLRQFPRGRTPKARVFCRYVSLLRYLFKQEDVDAVVILAHSQGTVISADLLKFLNDPGVQLDQDLFELEPDGKRVFKKNVYLFTMGCPLRQLYSERFPTWYDWAKGPSASLLGLKGWSNAYGAGDYIGRALWAGMSFANFAKRQQDTWVANGPPFPPGPAMPKAGGTGREFCIGPFAHIQYWNEPGNSVARELDRLINEAVRK